MIMHILRHDNTTYAERILQTVATQAGHKVQVVNPRMSVNSKSPDVVIARCELDSLLDPIFSDYLVTLHQYERANVPVINGSDFFIVGQDKYLSHLAVEQALRDCPIKGCFTPKTIRFYEGRYAVEQALRYLEQYGSVVIKLPCSGRGEGVRLAQNVSEVIDILFDNGYIQESVLIQQPIEKECHGDRLRDMRLEVVRDAKTNQPFISRGYFRIGGSGQFLTNVSQGGLISPIDFHSETLLAFCELILNAVGGDVAGIDIARDVHGNFWFEEVNIAFETKKATIDLLGDQIWRDVLLLAEARAESGEGKQ